MALREVWGLFNSRALYRDKSVLSGKPTISRWDPALGFKVCTYEEFYSDAVDNTERGEAYNFCAL